MKLLRRKVYAALIFCAAIFSRPETVAAPIPAQLEFQEFFDQPVGSRGLRLTDKLKSLDGKQIRITGYVVRQETNAANAFLMTPVPMQLHDEHYGLADDLPAATLFVHGKVPKLRSGSNRSVKVEVRGVLSLGACEEADGRISLVRLKLTRIRPAKSGRSAH
jgi:hypothetical protein